MKLRYRTVRRYWRCSLCLRSFFLLGKARDNLAPDCYHPGTVLNGQAPVTMRRVRRWV